MSVINQVLQDLDARKTGRHGEDPVWAIEPPAIAEPPRRIPALTLTVPVVAIAVAALFGQGSWGWQTPDATARHSIGPTMAAGTADAAATTRGMIAGSAEVMRTLPRLRGRRSKPESVMPGAAVIGPRPGSLFCSFEERMAKGAAASCKSGQSRCPVVAYSIVMGMPTRASGPRRVKK